MTSSARDPNAADGPTQGPGAGRLTAIFSKCPRPGEVKTRLTPPWAPEAAAELAEAMLRDTVERCRGLGAFRTVLFFAPLAERGWFESAFPGVELVSQEGADLGERLAGGFARALARPGVDSVVAVGSDQPTLTPRTIEEAHGALEDGADVVLAPDAGGGYVLIGLRAPCARLFTGVRMSSDGMCAATVGLARELGLSVHLLPPGRDVDVAADVEALARELGASPEFSPHAPDYPRHTAAWLKRARPFPS